MKAPYPNQSTVVGLLLLLLAVDIRLEDDDDVAANDELVASFVNTVLPWNKRRPSVVTNRLLPRISVWRRLLFTIIIIIIVSSFQNLEF